MSAPKLKPCPFCGGKPKVKSWHAGEGVTETMVICQECFVQTDPVEAPYSEPRMAAAVWNRRALERVEEGEPSKLEERVARLEEAERYWWENATLVSAHRRLAKRVQELEERMVPERDLTPAEAMDAMAELVRAPASPEVIAMRNRHGLSFAPDGGCWGTIADKGLDPTDPAVWDEHWAKDGAPHEPVYASPTSPEDTEGLEVVAHQIYDGGHHYYSDGPTYNGRSTPLVRLSDAVALRQRLERVEEGGRP